MRLLRLIIPCLFALLVLAGCGSTHKVVPVVPHPTPPPASCTHQVPAYRPCGPHAKGFAVPPKTGKLSALPPVTGVATQEMYDSIVVSTVPNNPWAVAGYTSGYWPTYNPLVAAFPRAHHLSIAINVGHDADCLDVEPGDASPSQAGSWARRQIAIGHKLVCLYGSLSNIPTIRAYVQQAGIASSRIKFWCAWYRYSPGLVAGCSAVQWTDRALNRNLDQSTVEANFFGPVTPPGPSPATINTWRTTRNKAFSNYHDTKCAYPQQSARCTSLGAQVTAYQNKLWTVPAPGYHRFACFGSSARTKTMVCWIVRPQANHWSQAARASDGAYDRNGCAGPVSFPNPVHSPLCNTLRQRKSWFHTHATALVKAYS